MHFVNFRTTFYKLTLLFLCLSSGREFFEKDFEIRKVHNICSQPYANLAKERESRKNGKWGENMKIYGNATL